MRLTNEIIHSFVFLLYFCITSDPLLTNPTPFFCNHYYGSEGMPRQSICQATYHQYESGHWELLEISRGGHLICPSRKANVLIKFDSLHISLSVLKVGYMFSFLQHNSLCTVDQVDSTTKRSTSKILKEIQLLQEFRNELKLCC